MNAKRLSSLFAPAVLMLGLGTPGSAAAERGNLQSELLGANEIPIVLSDGEGRFVAQVHSDEIVFWLTYEELEDVQQAHIHVQHPWENGPITVFLCTNLGNTPPGAIARDCPASPGRVTGTIVASDVQEAGPISMGDLAALIRLMRDGATYVNIHTSTFPAGEVRGQTNPRRR